MSETPPRNYTDFLEEPAQYERRAVAFFDVMGWRRKIEAAGSDGKRVTMLKNIVMLFTRLNDAYKDINPFAVRQSTFSDNVVVSTEASTHSIFTLLIRLAMTQFVAAELGSLIRGGVTIGDIVHDEHVVFGPGLVRAYMLESTVADTPRIIVDPECFEAFKGVQNLGQLVATEDGVHFLDPWTLQFANTRFGHYPCHGKVSQVRPKNR
jgi:hypothetical protein